MANDEQMALLERGVGSWNAWRNENFSFDPPDLFGANLTGRTLDRANLTGANLRDADLCGAFLRDADLRDADLTSADLRGADLCGADFYRANLRDADLREAYLRDANLRETNLTGADLSDAVLRETVFANVDLSEVKGLETCRHIPIRLDAAIMETNTGWAADIKRGRHISDFSRWKDYDAYREALERLLRDLRVAA